MFRPFELIEPTSVAEAIACLEADPDDARIYAGGSELLLVMRLGLLHPKLLVNIKNIPGMDRLELKNGDLHIGSLVTHRRLEVSPLIREKFPLIADMESKVANIRVRNVGTLGGNLVFAEPHSDPATLFLIYEARVTLQSSRGQREVALDEFSIGPYETVMEPNEILTGISVPALPQGMRGVYIRWGVLERPTLNVAVGVRRAQDGALDSVRIAVGSVGPLPMRMRDIEAALRGASVEAACAHIAASGALLRDRLAPGSDIYGSDEYKIYMTKVLLQRALRESAGGQHE
jgi:aerobic carbon-monoxide dehydrogenase medium subunit